MLGAFYPFMRNVSIFPSAVTGFSQTFYRYSQHNIDTAISQEFYRWPLVTQAAKNALDIR